MNDMLRNKPMRIPKEEYCRQYTTEKDLMPPYDGYKEEVDKDGYSYEFSYE